MEQFLALIPEGTSVAAVVVIVMLFLKHLKGYTDKFDSMAQECHKRQSESQTLYQQQIGKVMENYAKVTEKTNESLVKLEVAVTRLAEKVH